MSAPLPSSDPPPTLRSRLRRLLALWFGTRPVGRAAYAASGLSLMAFKYATDAGWMYVATGRLWTPWDYLSPLYATRSRFLAESEVGAWVLVPLIVWCLPFLWIGASMTLRRGLDAGLSAWTGLLFFVPIVNYGWMLLLCTLPSREGSAPPAPAMAGPASRGIPRAAAPAAALGVVATLLSIHAIESYGAALFVGTPFAMGFVAGYRLNRDAEQGLAPLLGAVLFATLFASGALVLLALEGVLCLLMAAPLALLIATLGALLGRSVAHDHRLDASQTVALLLSLPLLMGAERAGVTPPLREVVSAVEIDAPPERVWPRVVGFSELPEPSRIVFRLGIAYPLRARIEGEGVGAVRSCEFSTGPFVEPITRWEEPRRLSFDVVRQPEPMHETSPYRVVHAPHLLDGLVSERGEFRLERLPGGRTRLEGSTWYRLDMQPQAYWGLWSDALIGAIHQRVLAHVKALSEPDPKPTGG